MSASKHLTAARGRSLAPARKPPGTAAALLACLAALLWLAGPDRAAAQAYPARSIRLLVGFPAGGPADIPGRAMAGKLSGILGAPIVVENKPGAGGMLATQELLAQPRDGYTLLLCTYFDPVNTLLYRKARYKVSDIAPVSLIARYDYAIAAPLSSKAATFPELMALAKASPGKINYGQLGIASTQNMLAKQLQKLLGVSMTGVTYKGTADAMQEVVAGRLDIHIGPPISVMPLYQGKQIKVLAVTGKQRLAAAPEVPTLTESGVPLVAFAFLGVCAGQGMPQPVIDKLNKVVVSIVETPAYRALVEKSGSVAASSTPAEMQAVIDAAVRDAAPIITEFGLQVD